MTLSLRSSANLCCGSLACSGGCAAPQQWRLAELQAEQLGEQRQVRPINPASRDIVRALFGRSDPDVMPRLIRDRLGAQAPSGPVIVGPSSDAAIAVARCFLQVADLPNFALDRLSRYEAALWRQLGQVLFALDALDRRKPQERTRRIGAASGREHLANGTQKVATDALSPQSRPMAYRHSPKALILQSEKQGR
jgi:hypothetical protein